MLSSTLFYLARVYCIASRIKSEGSPLYILISYFHRAPYVIMDNMNISCNCGHAVVIRVPLSNGLINAKIYQAVTTELPPFPGPYATSDYIA
jgi:hypothetical protein